jgi:nucleotide sugar dehydrogenase
MAPSTIQNTHTRVCIIGVGYVGEHLVEVFSRGYEVIGYDVSAKRVREMQLRFADNDNVTIQSTLDGLSKCNLFCISVPTLLKNDNSIDSSYVEAAAQTVAKVAQPGATIVMESSVSVGMTRTLLGGLRDKGFFVGFSPERVDPGRTDPPAEKIAKIISGLDSESLERVQKYYSKVYETVVPVSTMETAEMCKLYENCFRMINVAYVNEISDACTKHGIDSMEMINACASKPYGFMPFYPGLGVGGSCIYINPDYLFINNNLPLLRKATTTTRLRPKDKAIEFAAKYPEVENVLVIGAGFKPGQSLTLNSPSLDYAKALNGLGLNVSVYDPLVENFDGLKHITQKEFNVTSLQKNFDKVVIGMRQTDVDFSVLEELPTDMVVEAYLV